jgi:hypothetical protein
MGILGGVLILNSVEPFVAELVTTIGFSTKRVCGSSTTAVRMAGH